jgi:hypothetical protein
MVDGEWKMVEQPRIHTDFTDFSQHLFIREIRVNPWLAFPSPGKIRVEFSKARKADRSFFQCLEKPPRALSNPWKFCRRA